jgi:hypothetical protein
MNWVDNAIGQWLEYFDDLFHIHAACYVTDSDTIVWETGINTVTANNTAGSPADTIVITLDDTSLGQKLPIVQFAGASAAGEIYVPRAAIVGGNIHLEWYSVDGNETQIDPADDEDIDFFLIVPAVPST